MKLEYFRKKEDILYFLFRVIIGFVFFIHGAQKMFGWFGAKGTVPLVSLMGLAGVIEVVGGLAIALGFFSRLAALGGILDMLGALFTVHFPMGWNPLINKGEPALLYLAAFLVIITYGSKKWSLEKSFLHKETF